MNGAAYLGVDIGSAAVSAALVDCTGALRFAARRAHHGRLYDALLGAIGELAAAAGPLPLAGVGLTSVSPALLQSPLVSDSQVCLLTACVRCLPGVRSIVYAGGERFGLIRLDAAGSYLGSRTNTSCAAGTGSFLDQQARRLGLAGAAELAALALANTGPAPRISTRCAVFARTDLVHAQQAGHTLEEICDGVCAGVARNLADTVWSGEPLVEPALFVGGVACNEAVRRHLQGILGVPLATLQHGAVLGAAGAALRCVGKDLPPALLGPSLVLPPPKESREYVHPPLPGAPGESPARSGESFTVDKGRFSAKHPVDCEVYRQPPRGDLRVRMGIDIGSTSTKAMLVDEHGEPVAGFYTRTLGVPVAAVQALCEAILDAQRRLGARFDFLGVATTGSGRKLVGTIVRADLVVDEISAHARAASRVDPEVDTIIEIGGQDAKFTTLRDGMVTFCHMNTVCAAGTGSFLEEQAARLGCSLADYDFAARGVPAPRSSDRCAVFMERDINAFLSKGYSRDEILAAALYSVRENYLSKVARGAGIGNRISFQGATARNGALVEAFRVGLGKDIHVSRWCHLAGAWGAALLEAERGGPRSSFVGLAAMQEEIPMRAEQCALCANHCRLQVAEVGGETVACGFLCGRDYSEGRRVERNRSGFDLARERARAFGQMAAGATAAPGSDRGRRLPVIGLPAALALYTHLPLWKRFFQLLGVPVLCSEDLADSVSLGRTVQGAEFCAPVASLHGHVAHLADKADWIFLPTFMEDRSGEPDGRLRLQCYYTQFASALAAGAVPGLRNRCLMPIVSAGGAPRAVGRELHGALQRAGYTRLSRREVGAAFARARREHAGAIGRLQRRFQEETAAGPGPHVVLLGRAYNVLPAEMGKDIARIFASLGVKAFFQDMVPCAPGAVRRLRPLLDSVHWLNAARTLETAGVVADSPGLYAVYITSFECSPDSIALEYFRRIMDERGKPYLVLQLDDHDSTLGYETRVEAAVQSFRNHARREPAGAVRAFPGALPLVPHPVKRVGGKTLLLPNWDPLVNPLLAANLRREGIDARLLEETPSLIRTGTRLNTGQCLPLSIIAQEAVDFIRASGLDPAETALWMPTVTWSCNLGMFTPFLQALLEAEGGGMEKVAVYAGDFYYRELSLRAVLNAYRSYLLGGLLRTAACRLRPYECEPGSTDRAVGRALEALLPAFEGRAPRMPAVRAAAAAFHEIRVSGDRRPRVAVFGDFYVRDNDVMNQGLVAAIEAAGAEAVVTPYIDYVRIVIDSVIRKMALEGRPFAGLGTRLLWHVVDAAGAPARRAFSLWARRLPPPRRREQERLVRALGLHPRHGGESFDNLLKIQHVARAHPDVALFVQASPAFCCPSIVTEAMSADIERLAGVPVVSVTYDGTGRGANDVIVPYIQRARSRDGLRPAS